MKKQSLLSPLVGGLLFAGALVDPAQAVALGDPPAPVAPAPENTALGRAMLEPLGEPLASGRILFESRLRYENAIQSGLSRGEALTLRTRAGYETARFHGLYGLGEFENNWVLNAGDFAPYPGFNDGRTVIADPRTNRVNRLQAGFEGYNLDLTAGRQRINLDNQRFVGAVGWRQNDQTFDAVRVQATPREDLRLSYTWNWRVNRVFGSDAPAANLRRFEADNHFVNAHYDGLDLGTLGGYFYFLDLKDAPGASGTTGGGFLDGSQPLGDGDGAWTAVYRLEFAAQTDNRATGDADFTEYYYRAMGGARKGRLGFELNFETLTGDGTRAFQTPLATLHGFQGWNDVFGTTPPDGLRDYGVAANIGLPWEIDSRFVAQHFTAENNSRTYGNEIGASFSRAIGENLTALVKGARYWGDGDAPGNLSANRTKIWLQLDLKL